MQNILFTQMEKQVLDTTGQNVNKYLGALRPLEISETLLLCLFVATYPFSWQLSLYVCGAVLLNAVIRMICYRQYGNGYDRLARLAVGALPALYFVYLVSMTYTQNGAEGWQTMFHKLPMVLFPIYFLCMGLQYLTKRQLSLIGYAFAFSCTAVALFNIGGDLYKVLFAGAKGSIFYGAHRLTPHHTYNAMYFLFSMVFLYIDNKHHGEWHPGWWRVACALCVALLAAVTWFVGSRSGIIILICFVLWLLYDITFGSGHRKTGFGIVGGVVILTAVALFASQGKHNRLGETMRDAAGEKKDIRYEIWDNAVQVIKEHPVLGVGVGDRIDELNYYHSSHYATDWNNFNPHNQFLDSWVAAGLPGILLTMAIYILPAIYALRKRPAMKILAAFVLIAGVTSLVESVLERQMGILFICFIYCLLLLPQSQPAETRQGT